MVKQQAMQIGRVARALARRYGSPSHHNRRNPFEELLFILCSLQTNEELYLGTFRSLRRSFPRSALLAKVSESQIAAAIQRGGLSAQKARAISLITRRLQSEFGRVTLAPLRQRTTAACEAFLTSLPGIGTKTARCILMYSLGRSVFPVDTHCWRICRRLGWVHHTRGDASCGPQDMDRLQSLIPPRLRFSLHVNMVAFGRDTCAPGKPKCSACAIQAYCKGVGVAGRV